MVYERLCKDTQYDILMGHSMGGGLLIKYIREHKTKRVILLMPLFSKRIDIELVCQIPLTRYMYLPTELIIPNRYLCDQYTKKDYKLIPVAQIYDAYNDPSFMSDDLDFINNNPDVYMIYAQLELLNVISDKVLDSINKKQLKYVNGLHECFNSVNEGCNFFEKLDEILNYV